MIANQEVHQLIKDGVRVEIREPTGSIRSENLFKQDLEAFADLKKVLPIGDVSDDGYRENYARPINAKESLVDKTVADTEDRHQSVRRALECLREKGTVR